VAYRLKFSSRAVREIGEAFDWYEDKSEGLGSEFELAFELQLKRLEQAPLLYPEVIRGVRRTLLPRFPYGVFYTVKRDLVYVLAVIHNVRNPRRWPSEREHDR
jgi:toxin ParE1/3/4